MPCFSLLKHYYLKKYSSQDSSRLISQFGLEFVKKNEFKKELFDLLARAQEDREEADYGLFSK